MTRHFLAAAGAALVMMITPVAGAAQTPPGQDRAAELVRAMFEGGDFRAMLQRELPRMSEGMSRERWFRPEWKPLLEEAFMEEVDHDLPKLHVIFGRELSKVMTEQEIAAGLALMSTRGGRAMLSAAGRGANSPPNLSRADRREMERIASTPAGRGFIAKMDRVNFGSEASKQEFIGELMPGVMRRFGTKAEALQAR